ncbi:MAG: DUF2090 domain-containing protein [bacterium]|nr:DUF2090 domain-containing protein [bacterium]
MASLYILPFDHRGSFHKMLFPDSPELSDDQHATIKDYKHVIYEAMKLVGEKRGYGDLAILVDEQYGTDIHADCETQGIRHLLTTEKSGEAVFTFEYEDWKEHILRIKPTYAKALIRVMMGEDNSVQNARLKELGDFCTEQGIGFLIEPLVQPSAGDLESVEGNKDRFDGEIRPRRFAQAVAEMHASGVTPDVWKIEGTETKEGMDICSEAAFNGGKEDVQIVILGRGATQEKVDHWLVAGAKSKGVTGFAVGRTIFSDAIEKLHRGELSRKEASREIANHYEHCIEVFEKAQLS